MVLVSGPLGSGGRDADVLMFHQLAIVAVALLVGWSSATTRILTGRGSWILAAVVAHGILVSDYKYAAGLELMDWIAAALLFGIVAETSRVCSVSPIVAAVVGAATLNALYSVGRAGLGLGYRGLFSNPHHGATLMAVAASMLLVRAMLARGRARLLHGGATAMFATLIVALGSRGGMLALVAGCSVALLVCGRGRAVLALVALSALALVVPNPLSKRVWAGARGDVHAFGRLGIWSCSAKVARHEFLHGGAGLGQFEPAARRFNFPVAQSLARYGKIPNHAHNELLQLVAEAGVGGFLAGFAPLAWALGRTRFLFRSKVPPPPSACQAVAGLTAIVVHALVEFVLHAPAILYVTAGLLGVLAARRYGGDETEAEVDRHERAVATVAVLAAFTAWALLPWLGDREVRAFRATGSRAHLVRALRFSPGHAGYHRALGIELGAEYLRSGRAVLFGDAFHELTEALRLAPGDSKLWAERARFLHRAFGERLPAESLVHAALRDYGQASLLEPRSPFLLLERATLLGAVARYPEARLLVGEAVELEPNYVFGWRTLRRLCELTGDQSCVALAEDEVNRLDEWAPRQSPGTDYERALLRVGTEAQP